MSTYVLLINGSPKGKKSNTYKLATAFVEVLFGKLADAFNVTLNATVLY